MSRRYQSMVSIDGTTFRERIYVSTRAIVSSLLMTLWQNREVSTLLTRGSGVWGDCPIGVSTRNRSSSNVKQLKEFIHNFTVNMENCADIHSTTTGIDSNIYFLLIGPEESNINIMCARKQEARRATPDVLNTESTDFPPMKGRGTLGGFIETDASTKTKS